MPQKWDFFPKDRTYRAFFVLLHKRNFFGMVPEGLNAFWTFVHAADSASLCMQLTVPVRFLSLWEGHKWGFIPKDRTYRAFLQNKLFFLIAPRDLHY